MARVRDFGRNLLPLPGQRRHRHATPDAASPLWRCGCDARGRDLRLARHVALGNRDRAVAGLSRLRPDRRRVWPHQRRGNHRHGCALVRAKEGSGAGHGLQRGQHRRYDFRAALDISDRRIRLRRRRGGNRRAHGRDGLAACRPVFAAAPDRIGRRSGRRSGAFRPRRRKSGTAGRIARAAPAWRSRVARWALCNAIDRICAGALRSDRIVRGHGSAGDSRSRRAMGRGGSQPCHDLRSRGAHADRRVAARRNRLACRRRRHVCRAGHWHLRIAYGPAAARRRCFSSDACCSGSGWATSSHCRH